LNKEKRPGAKTKIIVKAKPGSRVALAALDKSILLLGNAEGITKEDVRCFRSCNYLCQMFHQSVQNFCKIYKNQFAIHIIPFS
jgi:hypothetical protein